MFNHPNAEFKRACEGDTETTFSSNMFERDDWNNQAGQRNKWEGPAAKQEKKRPLATVHVRSQIRMQHV